MKCIQFISSVICLTLHQQITTPHRILTLTGQYLILHHQLQFSGFSTSISTHIASISTHCFALSNANFVEHFNILNIWPLWKAWRVSGQMTLYRHKVLDNWVKSVHIWTEICCLLLCIIYYNNNSTPSNQFLNYWKFYSVLEFPMNLYLQIFVVKVILVCIFGKSERNCIPQWQL